MTDLELASNDELIEELLRRPTFRGVILWQSEQFRGRGEDEWKWRSMNCDAREIVGLLGPQLPEGERKS